MRLMNGPLELARTYYVIETFCRCQSRHTASACASFLELRFLDPFSSLIEWNDFDNLGPSLTVIAPTVRNGTKRSSKRRAMLLLLPSAEARLPMEEDAWSLGGLQ